MTNHRDTESAQLHAILDDSPIGVSLSRRRDGTVVFANRTFASLIGLGIEAVLGSRARDYFLDDAQRLSIVDRLKRHGRINHAEAQFRRADGSPFWGLLTIRVARFDGEEVNLAWIYDITDRKIVERELMLAAKVFETANEGILITNAAVEIQAVNLAYTHITGYTAEESIGRKPGLLASGRHPPSFYATMWSAIDRTGRWQGEVWNRRKNGELFIEWLSIAALRDETGAITQYLGVFSDITARKEDEDRIWHQANYDALTGLPNRALFLDRLSTALRQAARDHAGVALLFIDLDGFKAVNDTLGHAAGDQLLQETGQRLAAHMRKSDTVARLSGDEFVVLIENVAQRDDVALVAGKLLASIAQPYDLNGHATFIGSSIGIAQFPDDAQDVGELMNNADAAMYRVKRAGKNSFAFFDA